MLLWNSFPEIVAFPRWSNVYWVQDSFMLLGRFFARLKEIQERSGQGKRPQWDRNGSSLYWYEMVLDINMSSSHTIYQKKKRYPPNSCTAGWNSCDAQAESNPYSPSHLDKKKRDLRPLWNKELKTTWRKKSSSTWPSNPSGKFQLIGKRKLARQLVFIGNLSLKGMGAKRRSEALFTSQLLCWLLLFALIIANSNSIVTTSFLLGRMTWVFNVPFPLVDSPPGAKEGRAFPLCSALSYRLNLTIPTPSNIF